MRILIADYLKDQRLILRLMCGGRSIIESSSSSEVLAKCKEFDIIFTEVTFPGLAGDEYLNQLRRKTHAKIVVVTAQRENYHADLVIRKPFYKREILDALQRFES